MTTSPIPAVAGRASRADDVTGARVVRTNDDELHVVDAALAPGLAHRRLVPPTDHANALPATDRRPEPATECPMPSPHPKATRQIAGRLVALLAGTALIALPADPAVAQFQYPHELGTFAQVLCADPATGQGAGVSSVEGLTSPASVATWSAPITAANCGTGPMTAARAVTLQASRDGSWAPGTYGALKYELKHPDLALRMGVIFRSLESASAGGTYGHLAVNQHGGADPGQVFALPRNDLDEGDWKSAPGSMNRGMTTEPFHGLNAVSLQRGIQDGRWTVTAACEPQGAAGSCAQTTGQWRYRLFGGRMTLGDDRPPQVAAVRGPLADDEVITGNGQTTFTATDRGGGLYRVNVYVDNQLVHRQVLEQADGRCRDVNPANGNAYEFAWQRPCEPALTAQPIDWSGRSVPQGPASLRIVLEDAAGNAVTLVDRLTEFDDVPNPRIDQAPGTYDPAKYPSFAAAPRAGQTIAVSPGRWRFGTPWRYAWARCTTTECTTIAGVGTAEYRPTAADVGFILRAEVTAVNAAGDQTTERAYSQKVLSASTASVAPPVAVTPTLAPAPAAGADLAAPAPAPLGATGAASAPAVVGRDGAAGLAGAAGAPGANGRGADRAARITLRAAGSARARTAFGSRVPLSGRLTDAAGAPIGGAQVPLLERHAVPGAPERQVATATTAADGSFAVLAVPGPSRTLRVTYRAFAGDRTAAAAAAVGLTVRAALSLSVKPARPGRTTWLTGALTHLPRAGIKLEVQARDGRRWRTFDTTTTTRGGRYRFGYRFKPTAAGRRFHLRVLVDSPLYPFARGSSRPAAIRVPG